VRKKGFHDIFFKEVFSHKAEMQDFVIHTFPTEIVNNIDFETLVFDNTSYTDKRLRKYFADLVYTCTYKGQIQLKLALLFEHKSDIVEFPQFQLLAYIQRIWEICAKKKETRIVVVPIIFYHGKKPWIKKEIHEYFGTVDEQLKKFIPQFEYILIDTSNLNDADIKSFTLPTLQIAIFLLKYIFNKKLLQQKFEEFFKIQNIKDIEDQNDFLIMFYEYLLNYLTEKEMETVLEKVTELKSTKENFFVKRFEKRIFNKAVKQEKYEIARKMILKGFTNEIIRQIIGISDKELDKIRKEIEKSK